VEYQQCLKNAVSSSVCITVLNSRMINDQWTVNWRGYGRKCSWPNMRHCTEVFLEGLRNITKTIASRVSLLQDVSLGAFHTRSRRGVHPAVTFCNARCESRGLPYKKQERCASNSDILQHVEFIPFLWFRFHVWLLAHCHLLYLSTLPCLWWLHSVLQCAYQDVVC